MDEASEVEEASLMAMEEARGAEVGEVKALEEAAGAMGTAAFEKAASAPERAYPRDE